jgi:hypothetical protein
MTARWWTTPSPPRCLQCCSTEPRIPGSRSIKGAAFATLVPVSDLSHSRHYPRSPVVLSPTRSAVRRGRKKAVKSDSGGNPPITGCAPCGAGIRLNGSLIGFPHLTPRMLVHLSPSCQHLSSLCARQPFYPLVSSGLHNIWARYGYHRR